MDLVVILGVVWLVVLGPGLWRRYREHDSLTSVLHFHHQLRVLEEAEPRPLVRPAFRLRSVDGSEVPVAPVGDGGQLRPVLTVVGADRLPRPALACLGDDAPEVVPGHTSRRSGPEWPRPTATGGRARNAAVGFDHGAEARRLARRRRRDILGALVAVTVVTFLVGFAPGAGLAWVMTGISAVGAASYVALLAHHRTLVLERERKLRSLERPARSRSVDHGDELLASSRGYRSEVPGTGGGEYRHAGDEGEWYRSGDGRWYDVGAQGGERGTASQAPRRTASR
jgi:hypothetical protein